MGRSRPRVRFELGAAHAMGVGLPLLETLRRRTDFTHLLAGALLASRSAIAGQSEPTP